MRVARHLSVPGFLLLIAVFASMGRHFELNATLLGGILVVQVAWSVALLLYERGEPNRLTICGDELLVTSSGREYSLRMSELVVTPAFLSTTTLFACGERRFRVFRWLSNFSLLLEAVEEAGGTVKLNSEQRKELTLD